ncbi:uncharacterized protein LOC110809205 [Carica papaya]|uniref:uncharacterized protein LOC110809205 n=1 Tax=Carica papaya TaxID=3649 RepID=UPI000B8C9896|nr:uncharacterized protein LOC110809205 [Carica papaya]
MVIISLYVDDILITENDEQRMEKLRTQLEQELRCQILGERLFLGMEIAQSEKEIFISQKKYARELLKKFKLENCKVVSTPLILHIEPSKAKEEEMVYEKEFRSIIGSLLYLTATRLDLTYAISLLSRFMNSARQSYMEIVKHILRYVRGTTDLGIHFQAHTEGELLGYTDSDWVGSVEDAKSTSGYVFSLGSDAFSWSSKKQEIIAQSST